MLWENQDFGVKQKMEQEIMSLQSWIQDMQLSKWIEFEENLKTIEQKFEDWLKEKET